MHCCPKPFSSRDRPDHAHTQAFEQEKELSREAREARVLAAKFRDQTAGWVAAARRADAVMRDFGDHETFLQAIQDDMADIVSMLQRIDQV